MIGHVAADVVATKSSILIFVIFVAPVILPRIVDSLSVLVLAAPALAEAAHDSTQDAICFMQGHAQPALISLLTSPATDAITSSVS